MCGGLCSPLFFPLLLFFSLLLVCVLFLFVSFGELRNPKYGGAPYHGCLPSDLDGYNVRGTDTQDEQTNKQTTIKGHTDARRGLTLIAHAQTPPCVDERDGFDVLTDCCVCICASLLLCGIG
jgi:hypothetical protein